MKRDSLRDFITLRDQLVTERSRIQERLNQIDQALGSLGAPSLSALQGAAPPKRRPVSSKPTKSGGRRMTPAARARIAEAARRRWSAAKAAGRNRL